MPVSCRREAITSAVDCIGAMDRAGFRSQSVAKPAATARAPPFRSRGTSCRYIFGRCNDMHGRRGRWGTLVHQPVSPRFAPWIERSRAAAHAPSQHVLQVPMLSSGAQRGFGPSSRQRTSAGDVPPTGPVSLSASRSFRTGRELAPHPPCAAVVAIITIDCRRCCAIVPSGPRHANGPIHILLASSRWPSPLAASLPRAGRPACWESTVAPGSSLR